MRVHQMAAQLFGLAAVAVGCLAAGEAKADYPYSGGYYGESYHGGYRGGYGGGYRGGYGGGYRGGYGGYRGGSIYNRPGDGLPPLYNRRGDGLPPLPVYRTPGGGLVANRPGDGIPPIYIHRPRPW
ncbi:hypothetical protein SAMN05444166_3752 [Singulisphaera sp. GP187]|uniref:hypothetical protein n=1 Tax=Singulisphaera sp. GP187 TaxID=1882752 RepID=UPI000928E8F7|nr:hypothetical protein [Singulisphaera sp. GP187]SIO31929.1 hypothetical protein SAMN05444166_3752 [Singulisphaera sp. GP187]